jgi:hypothetical protein
MAAKSEQLDIHPHPRGGLARYHNRIRRRAMRRLDRMTLTNEDAPSRLPFNRYHGWVS